MRFEGTLVKGVPRQAPALFCVVLGVASACLLVPSAVSQDLKAAEIHAAPLGPVAQYQGLVVRDIQFRGIEADHRKYLLAMLAQKTGEPLERTKVRNSIQTLYQTGRFSDIQAEAERTPQQEVTLIFVTSPNYFVGEVKVEGAPTQPTANQIISATKLQLGELFTREKVNRALDRIEQLLAENGYYRSRISDAEQTDAKTQQISILIKLSLGERAHVGAISVRGKPGYSNQEIQDISGMDPGDTVTADRVSNALERLRKRYQKKNRLLAQVSVEHQYRADKNAVEYTFDIDPGPVVQIAVEGIRLRKAVIKKNIPVFQENALDEDLLMEGRRNLLDYLETRGFFDAKADIQRSVQKDPDLLRVTYVINAGPPHRLVKVSIAGNKYFSQELLKSRMQVQAKGRAFSHGRYNQSLLNDDIRGLEELYRTNGFAEIKITSQVIDDYQGVRNQLAINLQIEEGPQTLVGVLHIVGNRKLSEDQLRPLLSTAEGQPFSNSNVSNDRDSILNEYFNHGFPNASFEASAKPMPGNPQHVEVTFAIHEGDEIFVDQVLVTGLEHTRPYIVQHQLQVHPGDPLSQLDMLDTQRRLYDQGIFNQVDTAVQNPEGKEADKNVLINVREAKRYTFNYGLGLELQTGQPAGVATPTGRTGVSPRVSFDVTRLNFRGRDHSITFKSHAGRLQQRVLVSYDAPRWFNRDYLRMTFTSFYDNTLDVTTFTSQRLEGSVQAAQAINKASTIFYRFAYREVRALNFASNFTKEEVPLLSQPVRVGMPGFSYIRDHRDNPLESTKGNYTTFDLGVAASSFGSQADFSRTLIVNSSYHPIKKSYVLARSTTIGLESSFGNTYIISPFAALVQSIACHQVPEPGNIHPPCSARFVPLPERFFSGGGNSLRGFGLNQAGPRDLQSGFPVGGSGLLINNLELRLPPLDLPFFQDNLSFAFFHDAGNVFDTGHDLLHSLWRWSQKDARLCSQLSTYSQCDFNYISHAVGLGVRYKTPIGPVRFDLGYNLNPPLFPTFQANTNLFAPKQAAHFNVYFSVGQTF